mgnify:CR=1 FL=1
MHYISLVLLLLSSVFYVGCVNSEAQELVSFSQAGLVTRDGLTGIDSVNIIRCLFVYGVPSSSLVGVSKNGGLTIVTDRNIISKDLVVKAATKCYRIMGFGVLFGTRYDLDNIDDLTIVGNIAECVREEATGQLNTIGRAAPYVHNTTTQFSQVSSTTNLALTQVTLSGGQLNQSKKILRLLPIQSHSRQ